MADTSPPAPSPGVFFKFCVAAGLHGTSPDITARNKAPCKWWLTSVRHSSHTSLVTINYMQMLLDLMEERQKWIEEGRIDSRNFAPF
jgi:hypothetical protein